MQCQGERSERASLETFLKRLDLVSVLRVGHLGLASALKCWTSRSRLGLKCWTSRSRVGLNGWTSRSSVSLKFWTSRSRLGLKCWTSRSRDVTSRGQFVSYVVINWLWYCSVWQSSPQMSKRTLHLPRRVLWWSRRLSTRRWRAAVTLQ